MKKKAIKTKYIVICAVILLLISGICVFLNSLADQSKGIDGYSLSVSRNGEVLKTFSLDQIKKMDSVTVRKTIRSGSKKDEEGLFKGVPLSTILNKTDKSILEECGTFTTFAGDSFSSALSAEDMLDRNNVLVIYAKDGKDLMPISEGGEGPMRIIIQSDQFGNRSTMNLIRVDCE